MDLLSLPKQPRVGARFRVETADAGGFRVTDLGDGHNGNPRAIWRFFRTDQEEAAHRFARILRAAARKGPA